MSLHTSRSATGRPEPIKLTVTTVEPGKEKKPKVGQAYSRLTELSKKGNLTDKVGRGRTGPAESAYICAGRPGVRVLRRRRNFGSSRRRRCARCSARAADAGRPYRAVLA